MVVVDSEITGEEWVEPEGFRLDSEVVREVDSVAETVAGEVELAEADLLVVEAVDLAGMDSIAVLDLAAMVELEADLMVVEAVDLAEMDSMAVLDLAAVVELEADLVVVAVDLAVTDSTMALDLTGLNYVVAVDSLEMLDLAGMLDSVVVVVMDLTLDKATMDLMDKGRWEVSGLTMESILETE